jgi:hypothetical protein
MNRDSDPDRDPNQARLFSSILIRITVNQENHDLTRVIRSHNVFKNPASWKSYNYMRIKFSRRAELLHKKSLDNFAHTVSG